MSIAIFGGSFDPVHNGHVRLAENVLNKGISADRIIIVPACVSPFKQEGKRYADGFHRLNMCKAAFAHISNAEVSDYELRCKGISYTVSTLKHFHSIFPDEKLYFIVGSDSLRTLPTWKDFPGIMKLCTIAAAARSEEDRLNIRRFAEDVLPYGEVVTVDCEPFEISSTEIRRLISEGKDISPYVPGAVAQYIGDNRLYSI
ncbi:MAG: nicotinate (nicotinamide) nucleotide adenylyltransferase [Oscillospiraceae bacterium]